jgi:tetratricopeptide (TPR) repeat protein
MNRTPQTILRAPVKPLIALCLLACALPACRRDAASNTVGEPIARPESRSPASTSKGDGFVEQARDLKSQGRDDEALALLSRAIEQNPTLTVAHLEMADIFEKTGDYESAEKSFSTAANQQPSNFDAQFGHGRVLQSLNRIAEAVRAYLRCLSIRPDHFEANLNLATAYITLEGPAQALPYAQRAVQLNPASGPAHANLGAVYSALGRHREAVDHYQSASELMQLTPALLLNMAESLGKLERYEEMVNTLDVANRVQPTAQAYERVGFARFKLKQFETSMVSFRQALALDPDHFPALNGLGVCLLNQYILSGKTNVAAHDEAMSNLKRSLRINQRQPKIVELIARYER